MTHHSCIGWVQIGGAWPCTCSTSVYVQSLSAAHAFAMVWRLICVFCRSSLTFYGVNYLSDFPFFITLLLSRAGPCLIVGFPPFSPFFAHSVILLPFLPYHSVVPAMVSFDPCFLSFFWACCLFFSQ